MNTELDYKELSSKDKEEIMKLFKTSDEGLNKGSVTHRLEK